MSEIVKKENQLAENKNPNSLAISKEKILSFLDLYGFSKLSNEQKGQFVEVCQICGLNPFKKEVYISSYGNTFAIITGFITYLKRAELSGRLDGWYVNPLKRCKTLSFDYSGNIIEKDDAECTIEIYRKDFSKPFKHTVKLSEYTQKTKGGDVNSFWKKSETMLKKVAMAQGFRLCFPDVLGDLPYTKDENESYINTVKDKNVDIQDVEIIEQNEPKKEIETPKPKEETKKEPKPKKVIAPDNELWEKAKEELKKTNPKLTTKNIRTWYEITDEHLQQLTDECINESM